MTERIRCIVPFCNHTRKRMPEFDEWICGDHWRLVPLVYRKVYGRRLRKWRRFGRAHGHTQANRLWRWLVAKACDNAGAIGRRTARSRYRGEADPRPQGLGRR